MPLQWWYTLGVVEDIGRIDARLGPDEPIEVVGGEVGRAPGRPGSSYRRCRRPVRRGGAEVEVDVVHVGGARRGVPATQATKAMALVVGQNQLQPPVFFHFYI